MLTQSPDANLRYPEGHLFSNQQSDYERRVDLGLSLSKRGGKVSLDTAGDDEQREGRQ